MASVLDKVAEAIEVQEGFHKPGTRARRNRNPGNIKYGAFARSFGALGRDDENHAIFASVQDGRRALRELLRTKFRGQTLQQIGKRYAEDPAWAGNVAKIAQLDPAVVVVA